MGWETPNCQVFILYWGPKQRKHLKNNNHQLSLEWLLIELRYESFNILIIHSVSMRINMINNCRQNSDVLYYRIIQLEYDYTITINHLKNIYTDQQMFTNVEIINWLQIYYLWR